MFASLRHTVLIAWAAIIVSSSCTDIFSEASGITPPLSFGYEYVFTAHLNLGPAGKPIPVPGGVRVVEAILNGTVSGPAINATLGYSLATPTIVNNGTTQIPVINAVGMTDDGQPLYLFEAGIGSPNSQITRIQLEIGGSKYAALRNGFILAAIQASADRKSVMVVGYLITNTVSASNTSVRAAT